MIKQQMVLLLNDKRSGLGDKYFNKKKFLKHVDRSMFVYDNATVGKKELEKSGLQTDIRYSVTISESGYMIITYRGTKTVNNWFSNLDFGMQRAKWLKRDPKVLHDGYESDPEEDDEKNGKKKGKKKSKKENSLFVRNPSVSGLQRTSSMRSKKGQTFRKNLREDLPIDIHTGFYEIFRDTRWKIFELLDENIKAKSFNFKDIKQVIFTGHSLGGALATLAYTWFRTHERFKNVDMELVTFGSPKVGGGAFKERFMEVSKKSKITKFSRFVYRQDLFPVMPCTTGHLAKSIKDSGIKEEEEENETQLFGMKSFGITNSKKEEEKENSSLGKGNSNKSSKKEKEKDKKKDKKKEKEKDKKKKGKEPEPEPATKKLSVKEMLLTPDMITLGKYMQHLPASQIKTTVQEEKLEIEKKIKKKLNDPTCANPETISKIEKIKVKEDFEQRHVTVKDKIHIKMGKIDEDMRYGSKDDHAMTKYMEKMVSVFEPKLWNEEGHIEYMTHV